MDSLDKIKGLITSHPDFPKKGITFFDIHPIMRNAEARQFLVDQLAQRYADKKIDLVIGLESRGYYFGIPLADKMGLPFVPLRKAGKLPGECIQYSYGLEYGTDTIEVQRSSIPSGSRVVIIDDLLATGGTAGAAIALCEKCEATIVEFHVQMELTELNGKQKLPESIPFYSFFQL